jgi:ParB/Sulfiredoxin domain
MSIPQSPEMRLLALDTLLLSDDISPREASDESALQTYAELYRDYRESCESEDGRGGDPLPPPDIFHIDGQYVVADGFHRVRAAQNAGLKELVCRVYSGTQRDAMLFAAQANAYHGIPYKLGDKRRILARVLADAELVRHSDRALGRRFGISHTYVARIREALTREPAAGVATVATPDEGLAAQPARADMLRVSSTDRSERASEGRSTPGAVRSTSVGGTTGLLPHPRLRPSGWRGGTGPLREQEPPGLWRLRSHCYPRCSNRSSCIWWQ